MADGRDAPDDEEVDAGEEGGATDDEAPADPPLSDLAERIDDEGSADLGGFGAPGEDPESTGAAPDPDDDWGAGGEGDERVSDDAGDDWGAGDPDEASADDGPRIDPDAPLGELAADLAAAAEEDPPEDDPFEAVDVGGPDAEEAWTDADGESEPTTAAASVEASAVAEARDEHVVDKRAYCQRCEFFSDPPESVCTHDGTDIVEVVDADRFRVRDCPKVDEDGFGTEDG